MKKIILGILMSFSFTLVASFNPPPITSEEEATRIMEGIITRYRAHWDRCTDQNCLISAYNIYTEDANLFCTRVRNLPGWEGFACQRRFPDLDWISNVRRNNP